MRAVGIILAFTLIGAGSNAASAGDGPPASAAPAPALRQPQQQLAGPACGGELDIRSRTEPPGPYRVGDRFTVIWELSHDPQVVVESDLAAAVLQALSSASLEPAQERSQGRLATRKDPVRHLQTLSVDVTSFTTGTHRVEPVPVRFKDAKGTAHTVSTPAMVISVVTILKGPKADPLPLKEPLPYPYTLALPVWVWLLLAGIVLGGWWLYRKFSRPKIVPAPPPLPPHEEALAGIEKLLAQGLVAAGQIKEFCDRLSDILRAYLGRRFGLASMGETSFELLETLTSGGYLAQEPMGRLGRFLDECDLAKFARHRPSSGDLEGLVQTARTLVETTRPASPEVKS